MLKAADLIAVSLDTKGKAISSYHPTEEGRTLIERILSEYKLIKDRVKA